MNEQQTSSGAPISAQFPQLDQLIRGKRLAYLDNAATTLKPRCVIDRISEYYSFENANVHRGAHFLAAQGTALYEEARGTVARFLGDRLDQTERNKELTDRAKEIVFTRGTTEGLNLIAHNMAFLGQSDSAGLVEGDEILLSRLEHHSNIVPWQLAAQSANARIRVVELTPQGAIDLADLKNKLSARTKIVSLSGCSNVTGSILPIREVAQILDVHAAAYRVQRPLFVVDGAQSITAERPLGLYDLGCDAFVFSGHKLFAPQGIGAVWIAKAWIDRFPPYQGGGSMIDRVTFEKTTWADSPQKFEAGTPHVAGAVGLGRAIDWFMDLTEEEALLGPKRLAQFAKDRIEQIGEIVFHSFPSDKTAAILTFSLPGVHASDLAELMDQQGVAVRAGHHCCQPLMEKWGVSSTLRASFAVYNNEEDVEQFVLALKKAKEML